MVVVDPGCMARGKALTVRLDLTDYDRLSAEVHRLGMHPGTA